MMFSQSVIIFILILSLSHYSVAQSNKPNVVIFFTDDHGTLDTHSYGAKDLYTPHIDALSKKGIQFTQAYSHTVCCPARASLLTGRYPQRGGVNDWTQNHPDDERTHLDPDEITIAEVLKEQGYQCGLFGKWHLGAEKQYGPLAQGFDRFYGFRSGFIENYRHYFMHREGFHDLWDNDKEIFRQGEYFPDLMVAEAKKYITRHKSKPMFLYISFNMPHYPEQYDKQFDEKYKGMDQPRGSYAKFISTMDNRIGEIIEHLKANGMYENTLFFFMSDNGHSEETYQVKVENHSSGFPKGYDYGANGGGGYTGQWIGHKGNFYEGGIRVPFIVSFPARFPQGVQRDQIVTNMDILPTVCDVLGITLPENKIDGHSLLPIIDNKRTKSFYETLYFQWQDKWIVREGDWKLIYQKSGNNEPGRYLLVNLDDPHPEQKNYYEAKKEMAERLLKLHKNWSAEVFENTMN